MPIHPAPRLPMTPVITAASLVGATTAVRGAASAPTADAATHPASAPAMSDADLDGLVAVLDALPDDVEAAEPRTTPDSARRLGRAIDRVACAASVAGVIAQHGLPVSEVVSSLREARALFGSASDIHWAIRSGRAAAEMGEEATRLIEALLGIDGVVSACSGTAAMDA